MTQSLHEGLPPTRFPSLWACVHDRSARSVTWSGGLVRSSANAVEPRRMRPELRPAWSASLMVFKSIRGSWCATAVTCVVGARGWVAKQDHPAYIPRRLVGRELRITRVSPCVARRFGARASFTFAGCCWG
jgi:hypothetical protein